MSKLNRNKENVDAWREKVAVEFTTTGLLHVSDKHAAAGDCGIVADGPPTTQERMSIYKIKVTEKETYMIVGSISFWYGFRSGSVTLILFQKESRG